MARPIPLEIAPRDARKELLDRLENAPAEHAEALLDAYEVLQQMHDARVFEVLRGVLSARDKVMETAVSASQTSEAINGLRNAIRAVAPTPLSTHPAGRGLARFRHDLN